MPVMESFVPLLVSGEDNLNKYEMSYLCRLLCFKGYFHFDLYMDNRCQTICLVDKMFSQIAILQCPDLTAGGHWYM